MIGKILRKLELGPAHSGLYRAYQELTGGSGSFRNDLVDRINNYEVQDKQLGLKGTLRELAKEKGLERELDNYINNNVLNGLRGNLRKALDYVTTLKDSIDELVEGTDLATGGITWPIQAPFYAATQTAYSIIAGILGYKAGIYAKSRRGLASYLADTAKGYVGAGINLIPYLGSIVEFGKNFDDKRPRIAQVAAHDTSYWFLNELRRRQGMPLLEEDLEHKVKKKGILENAKSEVGKLIDYGARLKTKNPVYGSDINPYAHEVYGRA